MERYHILAPAVELIFFFFFLQEEHLLKCASAELPSRHESGGDTGREDAGEEASKLTACSIKNTHLQYKSLEQQAAIILKLDGQFSISEIISYWKRRKKTYSLPLG